MNQARTTSGHRALSKKAWGVVGSLVVASGLILWRLAVLYKAVADEDAPTVEQRLAEGQLLVGVLAALLTVVIAGATFWYARLTRQLVNEAHQQVEVNRDQIDLNHRQIDLGQQQIVLVEQEIAVAQEQVEFSRATLVAASRALLVDVPWGVHLASGAPQSVRFAGIAKPVTTFDRGKPFVPTNGAYSSVYVPVRNVGPGTAVITFNSVSSSPGMSWPGTMTPAVVPPGEISELVFSVPRDQPELGPLVDRIDGRLPLSVYVGYTNAGGEDALRTRLDLVDVSDGNSMRVHQVSVFDAGATDDQPFVQSGPSGL